MKNEKKFFKINGGNKLFGEVKIQKSKNSVLPILAATLMFEDMVTLYDLPNITDVDNMIAILGRFKVKVTRMDNCTLINTQNLEYAEIGSKLSKSMRSSIFLLAPMLNKFKNVKISRPGGCKIGKRPIDIHLNALKKLGVKFSEVGNQIVFDARNAHEGKIKLKFPSVGATENIMMFACLTKGKTIIKNSAKEPEIVDLANFLNSAGAKILGAGTKTITIYGVDKLKTTRYTPISDRIVEGTILCAVAACGGNVCLKGVTIGQNKKLIEILRSIGCQIRINNDIINIECNKPLHSVKKIKTDVYPGFATDLQSIILPVLFAGNSCCRVKETVFENRFQILPQLKKMGAKVDLKKNNECCVYPSKLKGAKLLAPDLRGGAGLIIAGLMAEGETKLYRIDCIFRGYENIEKVFGSIGADIKLL